MALQGTIDSFAMADVLRLLGSSAKTGRLIVNGDRGTANLWLVAGQIVGGGSPTQLSDDIVDVVFDILRFGTGSFIFEAGAECSSPGDPIDVTPALAQAEEALSEWQEIIMVVPSLESWVTLAPELIHSEVVVDQACWASIVAVGGGATVRALGSSLGLGELPSSRLVRALVTAGFVEVDAVEPPHGSGQLGGLGTMTSDEISELPELPMRLPHETAPFDSSSSMTEEPPGFETFGGFDRTEGLAGEVFDGDALPSLTVAGLGDELFSSRHQAEPDIDDADLNRSMSMLSSKAAQALASLTATDDPATGEIAVAGEDERERMLRFLDSV